MANGVMFFCATLIASLLLDATVRPRLARWRRWPGLVLHTLVVAGVFGFFLAAWGNLPVAAVLTVALTALFTVASNAKYVMLGEPLVFSDLALVAGIFRHPRFYFTAIPLRQRWIAGVGGSAALLILALLFTPSRDVRAAGATLLVAATAASGLVLRSRRLRRTPGTPDLDRDLVRYGLVATLLLYWLRWRESSDPAACATLTPTAAQPERIIVVQCESFADPVALTGDVGLALAGLGAAQATAWQYGELAVSGFGAYTMRTEYGVLFGRSEAELGFRRYDPFLTAYGETSHALAARLKGAGYRSAFVHPHDMRFYGRDRLMPAIGFDRTIGDKDFAALPPGGGRYIDDRTLGAKICELVGEADGPALIYAVTMENHGPWQTEDTSGASGRLGAYLHHLRSSDRMLTQLIERLAADGKSALLVFFGDHRPSIPGVTQPGAIRHTPYVMLRFDDKGAILPGDNRRVDLTPAELHHAILRCVARPSAAVAPGTTDP